MKLRRGHACGLAMALTASVALVACTTLGSGSGSVEPGSAPVAFNWTSKDGGKTGTMTARLDDGQVFSGPFAQLASSIRFDSLDPMWFGWHRGQPDWGSGGPFSATASGTQYSGEVIANLQGPQDQRLRCRFDLNSPDMGMSGGGLGQCHLADGRTVDAAFARS